MLMIHLLVHVAFCCFNVSLILYQILQKLKARIYTYKMHILCILVVSLKSMRVHLSSRLRAYLVIAVIIIIVAKNKYFFLCFVIDLLFREDLV